MRKTLTAAAALAPLCFALVAEQARATTTISTGRTTPISTSTANNGAADDIDIASGGSITLSAPGTAVTLDSNNKITNEGSISFKDVDNAIGVLITGGRTGSFTNTGSISITESHTPSDTNSDGVNEAPFATGGGPGKSRYGVLVQGSSPFVGNITNDTGGTISVTGNNSYGMSVEAGLTGDLVNAGSITVTGNNSVALRELGGVTGNVKLTGSVTATGQGSNALVLSGDVTGRLSIYSSVTATGYGTTGRSSVNATQRTIQTTSTETQQSGSAGIVQASVAGGILIGAPVANTASGSTADTDGDGIADGSQTTGSVVTYGSQPSLLIGGTGKAINLGAVKFTTGTNPYGLIINGTVSGNGVFDSTTATGLQIGADGSAVNIAGGIKVGGTVSAIAYGADSTAAHLLSGANVPEINVSGAITSVTAEPLPNATTGAATPYSGSSHALLIDSGANVNALTVTGRITAEADGDNADSAYAVVDNSGKVSLVNMTGTIAATIVASSSTSTPTGAKVALDLSKNTTGVTINMNQAAQSISTAVTNNGTTTTTVTTGPVVQNTTGTAQVSTTTSSDGKTVTTTTTPVAPSIYGDILLGNGPNAVNINAGTIAGALNLGSNTASIFVDNGGSYVGALSYTGTGLSVNVNNGTLYTTNPATLTATSLRVGSSGVLNFAVDPANKKATNFIVNGTATLVAGAKIGVNLVSNLTGSQTYTLIKATTLNSGVADAALAADVPYLFFASASTNAAAGTVNLTIRQKTASEMNLNPAESSALSAIYAALPKDTSIQSDVFAQYTRSGFIKLYDQLLPDYSGGIFRAASAASRTISRLTGEPNEIENPTGSRGAWAQQFFVGGYNDKTGGEGFETGGFGYVGGVETGGVGFGAVGATIAFVALNNNDPYARGNNRQSLSHLEGGFYWQGETGGVLLNARVAGGYDWYSARRQFLDLTSSGTVSLSRQTKASWTGYSGSAHIGASYQMDLGPTFFVRPNLAVDYFYMQQGSYTERLGGDGFNLAYGSRTGDEASGTASMIVGAKLGRGFVWRPQFELGVRDTFSGTPGDLTARFAAGGSNFTISPTDFTGVSTLTRFKMKASSEYYEVGVEAGGEFKSRYTEGDVKLSVRVLF